MSIRADYACTPGGKSSIPKKILVFAPAKAGRNLSIYAFSLGKNYVSFLAPAKMTGKAIVGADTSFQVTLQSSHEEVYVLSTGPCGGCAAGEATPFFPSARKYIASEMGKPYRGICMETSPANMLQVNSSAKLFAYTAQSGNVYGLAYYNPNSHSQYGTFLEEVIILPHNAQPAMIPWMLKTTLANLALAER